MMLLHLPPVHVEHWQHLLSLDSCFSAYHDLNVQPEPSQEHQLSPLALRRPATRA
jgi:hypothetical protein